MGSSLGGLEASLSCSPPLCKYLTSGSASLGDIQGGASTFLFILDPRDAPTGRRRGSRERWGFPNPFFLGTDRQRTPLFSPLGSPRKSILPLFLLRASLPSAQIPGRLKTLFNSLWASCSPPQEDFSPELVSSLNDVPPTRGRFSHVFLGSSIQTWTKVLGSSAMGVSFLGAAITEYIKKLSLYDFNLHLLMLMKQDSMQPCEIAKTSAVFCAFYQWFSASLQGAWRNESVAVSDRVVSAGRGGGNAGIWKCLCE
eukprot:XP_016860930.1 uncharacterized protein LOC107985792 [Homo sapiens]